MKRNNFCQTDKLLHQRVKDLSESSQKEYNYVFDDIYHLTGRTPTELVKIGLREQDPYATNDKGEKTYEYLPFRTITSIHEEYEEYLRKNSNIKESTIKGRLLYFRSLFNKHRIELPDMPIFHIKKPRTRLKELPLDSELKLAIELSTEPVQPLLFLTPRVTGLRLSDIETFTYNTVLEATKLYHDGTLEDLLNKNPYEIIPRFELDPVKTKKQGNLCITFATPEWTYHFFRYTKWRQRKYEETVDELERLKHDVRAKNKHRKNRLEKRIQKLKITPESPLFISNLSRVTGLTKGSMGRIFYDMNEKLMYELGPDYNYKNEDNNYGRFRAHNLRKLFSTTCRVNMVKINVENRNDKFRELDIVSLFTGHTPPNMSNSEVYDAIEEDSFDSELRQVYTALVPFNTIYREQYDLEQERQRALELQKENERIKKDIDYAVNKKISEVFNKYGIEEILKKHGL